MAGRTCHNCVYSICDPEQWLRWLWEGQSIVPQCANHPWWPGQLHEVSGVPCRNYRPKTAAPQGDNVRWIPLGEGSYAYVDASDYEWLRQKHWHVYNHGYAARHEKGKCILMHREIMQPPEGMVVDHIDGNRANNCRFNLRVCTPQENVHNKGKNSCSASQFKGVRYNKKSHTWYAYIRLGKDWFHLGYFDTEEEAARAYDRKAVELFGEYARLNFPREWPPERWTQVQAQRQEESRKTRGRKKAASKKGRRVAAGKKPRTRSQQKTKARRTEKSEEDGAKKNEKRRKNSPAKSRV